MSQELNNFQWRPTGEMAALMARANMYEAIRQFFKTRNVLEVETPLMCARTVTDPYIEAFGVDNSFLQTSPEYAMKRLLAAGFKSMYQICKVFRREEIGSLHNCEFTMLEWYIKGFNHLQLIDQIDDLLQFVLNTNKSAIKITYHDLFQKYCGINPHLISLLDIQQCAIEFGINISANVQLELSITDWLHLLMSHVIEPQLLGDTPWIVYNFPVAQAALAKVIDDCGQKVAARFEVYMQGVELANGYHELQNPLEQINRFAQDNQKRLAQGSKTIVPDERLIAALEVGLPECAGVALGLDRLLMVKMKAKSIDEVLSFTTQNA